MLSDCWIFFNTYLRTIAITSVRKFKPGDSVRFSLFPTLQVTVRMFPYVSSYPAVTLLNYLGQSVAILHIYHVFTPVLYSSLSSPVNSYTQLNISVKIYCCSQCFWCNFVFNLTPFTRFNLLPELNSWLLVSSTISCYCFNGLCVVSTIGCRE